MDNTHPNIQKNLVPDNQAQGNSSRDENCQNNTKLFCKKWGPIAQGWGAPQVKLRSSVGFEKAIILNSKRHGDYTDDGSQETIPI